MTNRRNRLLLPKARRERKAAVPWLNSHRKGSRPERRKKPEAKRNKKKSKDKKERLNV